jgi:RIO kinase 1
LHDDVFDYFLGEGFILDVVREIKSGKEASVWLCRANPATTTEHLAALKVYHPREQRNFKNTGRYTQGRVITEAAQRGIARKGRAGRELEMGMWIDHEWAALGWLHQHGVRVPRPIATGENAILMSWVGDPDNPAPPLRSIRPDPEDAQRLFDETLRQVRLMLNVHVIHADLSAYNVLVHDGDPWIIDVPQSVDPREHRDARDILVRDVERITQAFARYGVRSQPDRIVRDLWNGWLFADLIPAGLEEFL